MTLDRHPLLLPCLIGFFAFFAIPAAGGDYTATMTFDPADLTFYDLGGFEAPWLAGCPSGRTPGAPILPWKTVHVAIPHGAAYLEVAVLETQWRALPGKHRLAPLPEPRRISNGPPQGNAFVADPDIYGKNAFYPAAPLEDLGTFDLYGQDFVELEIYPLRYNPKDRVVELLESITFRVKYHQGGAPYGAPLNLSEYGTRIARDAMARLAINPEYVEPVTGPSFSRSVLEAGQYDIVVITLGLYASEWDDYKFWRDKKGTPCTVVTRAFIEANYSGTTLSLKFRNFVKDAHATWGTMFFLFGGDTMWLPPHYKPINGDQIANDFYFSDFDSDWKAEVFVGRAPVLTTDQIQNFIGKVLTYEKNPSLNGFGKSVFFYAFDLDTKTPSEDMKKDIDADYLPNYLQVDKEYDSESGKHKTDVLNYLATGPNLINHSDHANSGVLGVGSVRHNETMNGNELHSVPNPEDRLGNHYSLGCHALEYDFQSIGEGYLRDTVAGGVSFIGNSRYGWYNPGWPYSLSGLYDERYYRALFDYNAYHIGDTLATSKNFSNPKNNTERYICTELTLCGDPAMPLWTDDISVLSLTCAGQIDPGSQSFNVTVKVGTFSISNALVCVYKEGEVYDTGYTSATGAVNFNINPSTEGILHVTATRQNGLPAEAEVTVGDAAEPPALTSLTPDLGLFTGGIPVTISGDNFDVPGGADVSFGGRNAGNVIVVNHQTITCTTPAAPIPGFVDVTVSTDYGSDTLTQGYEQVPEAGADPLNLCDADPEILFPPQTVNLAVTGEGGSYFLIFLSFDGGPLPTAWGPAGLGLPIYNLIAATLPASGYLVMPLGIDDLGPLTFYLQALVEHEGSALWAAGGNNPNGTGSLMFVLP